MHSFKYSITTFNISPGVKHHIASFYLHIVYIQSLQGSNICSIPEMVKEELLSVTHTLHA